MRIAMLVVLVAILLGGLLGTLVGRDPGYVLVAYGDTAVETSLWFGVLLLLIAYLLVRLVLFGLARFAAGGGRFGSWRHDRKARTAREQTVQGLVFMEEGRWADALRLLAASASRAAAPLINYLSAARAAHEMGDESRRDELLRLAHESTPRARFAVGLAQAKLQKDAKSWKQCLATLLQLRSESSGHPQVLSMLVDVYRQLLDWNALVGLLPMLKKASVFDADRYAELERECWIQCMESATGDELAQVYKRLSKELKRHPAVVTSFSRACVAKGDDDSAESTLRGILNKDWDAQLVGLYGEIQSTDPQRQLAVAEGWLKSRPKDADLLLTLGRVALMNEQWAKAREYLEVSVRLRPTSEGYAELGRLCSAQDDPGRGSEYFAIALSGLSKLPSPD